MKILFNGYPELLPSSPKVPAYGGPRIFTEQLIKYFKKNNDEFVALTLIGSQENAEGQLQTERLVHKPGIWLTVQLRLNTKEIINSPSTDIRKLTNKAIKALAKLIADEKPAVVFLSGFSLVNWYIMKAAHKANVPVVMSHHGLWFKELDKYDINPASSGIKIMRRMEKDISKHASHEIFLNEFSLNEYQTLLTPVADHRRSIIPLSYNPIFLNARLVPKKNSLPIKIGFVGRWDDIKNPKAFYDLAREAKRQGKNWEFHAVCKWTDNRLLRRLETKFKQTIKTIEGLQPIEMKRFYREMDLLVLPSHFDVSPTVVLEAALQNRGTLISPHIGWVSLYKKFKLNNWIYDFKDPKGAVKVVETLLQEKLPTKYIDYLKHHNSSDIVMSAHVNQFKIIIKARSAPVLQPVAA